MQPSGMHTFLHGEAKLESGHLSYKLLLRLLQCPRTVSLARDDLQAERLPLVDLD